MLPEQIDALKASEGTMLKVYDDATSHYIGPNTYVKGHPSIGWGRALDVHGITLEEASYLLANDLADVAKFLSQYDWYQNLDPVRQGVMEELTFGVGHTGVLKFVGLIADLRSSNFDGAADGLYNSLWAHQVQPSRRDRMVGQLRTGEITPTV